ncbi:hypothetical protein ACIBI9_21790 [Nonomuraea sp. NPDC050451]|uniref:hypothetical protein n=1 Tax=Nonomuraea sp. NPDC050451 TaxID=3364364 RepID=UPI0037AD6ED3
MRRPAAVVAIAAFVCSLAGAAHAEGEAPRPSGPPPLIGNVTIFNDEIIEPVSLPVSTCGSLLPLLGKGPTTCQGASRVSDDDA